MPGTSEVSPEKLDEIKAADHQAQSEVEKAKAEAKLKELTTKLKAFEETEAQRNNMPSNVIAALARVMAELPGIGKNNRSEQGYQYRGIEAITAEAQTLLGKYGVVFVPEVLERKVKDFTINNRPWTEDELKIVYKVYGPGGIEDMIQVGPLYGLGRDNSDKGANKSMTQAFKYALIQTLCIGDSKDDPDKDVARESDPVQQRQPLTPEVQVVADEWPDIDAFDRAHHTYGSTIGKLNKDQKDELKTWKAEQKFGPWMTPDEFDATMTAIRTLQRNSHIIETDTPQSPETPETGQPPVETPETNEPSAEQPEPPHESLDWHGQVIDEMNGRQLVEALKGLNLPSQGKVDELRHQLREYVSAERAVTQTQHSGQPGDACEYCGENPCVCAPDDAIEPQATGGTEPVQNGDSSADDEAGAPFK